MNRLPILAIAVMSASGAAAQDLDWTYRATMYGWIPGMSTSVETSFGTVETNPDAGDILSALDFAFMGSLSAQRGRLGFVGDFLYTDLSTAQDTPLPLYGSGTVDVQLTAFSGYALYRVTSDPKVNLDLGVGFRTFDIKVGASVSAGVLPAQSQSLDASWTDPLIAARLSVPINEDWFMTGFADYGTTGSDSETWQVYAGLGYKFNEQWSTQVGYRYMDINKEIDGRDVSIALDGVLFAFSYDF